MDLRNGRKDFVHDCQSGIDALNPLIRVARDDAHRTPSVVEVIPQALGESGGADRSLRDIIRLECLRVVLIRLDELRIPPAR